MKKLVIALAVILLVIAGCQTATPVTEAPDDIIPNPGGPISGSPPFYRADIIEAGKTNLWPPIKVSAVAFDDNVSVHYRSYIETAAGETRNNIVEVTVTPSSAISSTDLETNGSSPGITLSTSNIPTGIKVNESESGTFLEGSYHVLTVDIAKSVNPGEYTFQIGLVVDGRDHGQLPCTINVTK